MMSTILEEDNDEKQQKDVYKIIFINDDQEKDKDKQSLKLSSCDSNSENL